MWSLGSEHTCDPAHSPLYISPRVYAREDEADEFTPHHGLSGLPVLSWAGGYDRLAVDDNLRLLKTTEASAPAAPASRTLEMSPPGAGRVVNPPCEVPGQMEERCLEQVQSMVLGEVLKDIDKACKLLNITPDPLNWSSMHVQKWLLWTEHLYKLPHICAVFQGLAGEDLCSMTEADFRQRSLQCGDILYAHLDIWRSAAAMKDGCQQQDKSAAAESSWPDVMCNYPGQPIHLWQFLRELLHKPHNYSCCIRWLNKDKGIFKIEDSAYVARLWGIRKNRPAMNYDKLSRSIRQYYKKGIIRKPDVSRRLVYQFVHPV